MATKTFQQGASSYAGARDTHICGFNPTFNRGANGFVEMGEYTGGTNPSNGLLYFDLSGAGFTGSETVSSAPLSLTYQGNRDGFNMKTITFYRIVRGLWQEGSGTGVDGTASAAGDVNYTYFSNTGISWGTPGGVNTATDISTTGSVATPITTNTIGLVYTWDLATIVQSWITSGNNFGVLGQITSGDGSNGAHDFYSKEDATVSNRPLLTINYTTGGGATTYHNLPLLGVG